MQHAQLWKRILNEGFTFYNNATGARDEHGTESLQHRIITTTLIIDSLPIEHMEGEMVWEHYRGMPMPFRDFWIESKGIDTSIGVLFEVHDKESHSSKTRRVCVAIVAASHGCPVVVSALAQFDINDCGSLVLQDGGKFPIAACLHPAYLDSSERVRLGEMLVFQCLSNAFDVLMILACKNVSLAPRDNDPDQVKRAIKRHGGTPESYRYHTLVVRPPGAKSGAPAQEIGIMSRHVCRGHFSEYGPEFNKGLLFGKYAGRFYIPPHLKGDKKNGVVEKDYEVPPDDGNPPATS